MPGFESNRFIDLSEREAKHLICGICLNIYDNAVRSECEHTFCKSCVQQWIEDNHKECPECRTEFQDRRRSNSTRNENNLVLIGSHVFKTNLLANSMISELTIKCDYDFKGCQQTVKLDSLSAHVKVCPHRLCAKCGLTFGKNVEHNCLELLKNHLNEFKDKYEKQLNSNKQLIEENSKLKTKLQTNERKIIEFNEKHENDLKITNQLTEENSELKSKLRTIKKFMVQNDVLEAIKIQKLNSGQPIYPSVKYIIIGSYKTSLESFELNSYSINLANIPSNSLYNKSKYDLLLSFSECQELMYCKDPILPSIIIKVDRNNCEEIRDILSLGENSPNKHKFDINSNDPKHWYIIVVFKSDDKMFNLYVIFLESIETDMKIKEINRQSVKQFIDTAVHTNH